jgi:hypothetical protein
MNEEFDFSKLKSYSELQAEQESEVPEVVVEDDEDGLDEEEVVSEEVPDEGETDTAVEKPTKVEVAQAPWGKPGKVPKGIQDRFKKLTSKISELEAQVATHGKPVKQEEETFDLNDPQQLARYIELQVEMRTNAQAEARQKQATIQKDFDELNTVWTKNFEQAKADLPDYDDVMADSTVMLPKQTMRHIVSSDVGSYVSYTIAKNEDLQTEINNMTPENRHAKVLEIEKTVRTFLKGRTKAPVASEKGSVSTKTVPLKIPGATVKKAGGKSGKIDWSTASMEELIDM